MPDISGYLYRLVVTLHRPKVSGDGWWLDQYIVETGPAARKPTVNVPAIWWDAVRNRDWTAYGPY